MSSAAQAGWKRKAAESLEQQQTKKLKSNVADQQNEAEKTKDIRSDGRQSSVSSLSQCSSKRKATDDAGDREAKRSRRSSSVEDRTPPTSPTLNGVQQSSPMQKHQANGAAPEDQEQPRSPTKEQQEQLDKKLEQALELFNQLALFLEGHRHALENGKSAFRADRARTMLVRACELATDPDLRPNAYLRLLPGHWFDSMVRLQHTLARTKELEEQLQQRTMELEQAAKAFDDCVRQRTDLLLDTSDAESWPPEAVELHTKALQAREQFKLAEEECELAQDEVRHSRELEKALAEGPTELAEHILVENRFMLPGRSKRSEQHDQGAPEDGRLQSGADQGSNAVAPDMAKDPESQGADRYPPQKMEDLVRDIKKHQFNQARQAYSDASKNIRRVRDKYRAELRGYLADVKDDRVIGTKTDFDRACFLEHAEKTNELGLAEAQYEFAKREARRTGAYPREKWTSDFGDWTDDGYDDVSDKDSKADLIWQLKKEKIEDWRVDEGQKEVVGQNEWTVEQPVREAGYRSIGPYSEAVQEDFADRKRRKLIDAMIAHQEELRAIPAFVALRSNAVEAVPEVREKYWFEEVCGI